LREWVDPASRLRTAIASRITRGRDEALDGPGTIKPFRWLAFGGVYVAMMLTMAVSMARRTRQIAVDGPAAVAEQRYRRVNVLVPVLVGYGVAIQWKLGGLLYFNPRDPAMWAENRVGVGYTLNVGNWRAWLIIIGIMLAPMIAGRLLF